MFDSAISFRRSNFKAIAIGGLTSGAFDLIFAIIYYGNRGATTAGILHSIAGGLLGKTTSNAGGVPTAILGLVLHFFISCSAAVIYFLGSRKIRLLRERPIFCGIVYGAIIYFFMNMVVLPLSAYQSHAFPPPVVVGPIAIHLLGVGLPIALAVSRYAK